MNPEVEKIGLIDMSLEDDLLIDKHFDNSSFDLRLSVTFETQMELVRDLKPRQYSDNARNSLAWDNAFFTSPGFLELEELCLVNRGFKDPQRQSVCGNLESTRRKICLERDSGRKGGIAVVHRQNTPSLARTKLASPNKMMIMQDSQHQLVTTRRSEAFLGAPSKSQVMLSTTSRREYLKSGKATSQTRFSTAHNKTPPLHAIRGNGKTKTPERLKSVVSGRTNSRDVSSVSSSLPLLQSSTTNSYVGLSPYKSKDFAARTVNLTKSKETEGEISLLSPEAHNSGENKAANVSISVHTPTKEQNHRLNGENCKRTPPVLQERKAPTRDKAHIYQDKDDVKSSDKGQTRKANPIAMKRRDPVGKDEKENIFPSEDTVIELKLKQRSPIPVHLDPNGSSKTSKSSGSSNKGPIAAQRPSRQMNLSPMGTKKNCSTKTSPLQRSSFF